MRLSELLSNVTYPDKIEKLRIFICMKYSYRQLKAVISAIVSLSSQQLTPRTKSVWNIEVRGAKYLWEIDYMKRSGELKSSMTIINTGSGMERERAQWVSFYGTPKYHIGNYLFCW